LSDFRELESFRIIDRKLVFQGRLLALEELEVSSPAGELAVREAVRHPGAIAVLPVMADLSVVLCKQYRAPIDDVILEVIAGKLKAGESPQECARRELAEEAGLAAESLEELAVFFTSPGFTDEVMHAFLARGIATLNDDNQSNRHGIEEIHMELVRVRLREWPRLVEERLVRDAKSIVTLALAARYLGLED